MDLGDGTGAVGFEGWVVMFERDLSIVACRMVDGEASVWQWVMKDWL